MKKTLVWLMLTALCLTATACSGQKAEEAATTAAETTQAATARPTEKPSEAPTTEEPTTEEPTTEEPTTEAPDLGAELFGRLPESFLFSSGVGFWGTTLSVQPDGSFSGSFHDTNMGERGEGYPNGTVYACDFTGRFGAVEQLDDYTYLTHITALDYANDPGTEELRDGQRICYATAYGLEGAEELYIYTPDAPLSELPEAFKSWYIGLNNLPPSEPLGRYGIYNVTKEQGFFGRE